MIARLHQAVLRAHDQSARRRNISHDAVILSAIGSGDYSKSVMAALSTIGGIHAPLAETYDLLIQGGRQQATQYLQVGKRIPGWGNAFHKGEPDPLWQEVDAWIKIIHPSIYLLIEQMTAMLHEHKKLIFPNPSCYTAATGIILGYTRQTTGQLFIEGRLAAWADIFKEHTRCL